MLGTAAAGGGPPGGCWQQPEQASFLGDGSSGAIGCPQGSSQGQFLHHRQRHSFFRRDRVTGVALHPLATPPRTAGVHAARWQPFLTWPVPEAVPLPALPQHQAPGQLGAVNSIPAASQGLCASIFPRVCVLITCFLCSTGCGTGGHLLEAGPKPESRRHLPGTWHHLGPGELPFQSLATATDSFFFF